MKAVPVVTSESDSPLLSKLSCPMIYASKHLNPLSKLGTYQFTKDDCSYSTSKLGPKVCFSERVKDIIDLEWCCAVLIKLVGKPNNTNALKFMFNSLNRKWKMLGPWQFIDLPNGYFVVKFHLHEDMNTAVCGGPWIIAGQTLVVQQWKPNFNPFSNEIATMVVWVRIVGLVLRFCKDFTMRRIGKLLGNVVKVDKLTLAQTHGQFGMVCVEIDLQKPLVPHVDWLPQPMVLVAFTQ